MILDGGKRDEQLCSDLLVKGHDLFDIRDGKIARLEIIVTEMPDMAAAAARGLDAG